MQKVQNFVHFLLYCCYGWKFVEPRVGQNKSHFFDQFKQIETKDQKKWDFVHLFLIETDFYADWILEEQILL